MLNGIKQAQKCHVNSFTSKSKVVNHNKETTGQKQSLSNTHTHTPLRLRFVRLHWSLVTGNPTLTQMNTPLCSLKKCSILKPLIPSMFYTFRPLIVHLKPGSWKYFSTAAFLNYSGPGNVQCCTPSQMLHKGRFYGNHRWVLNPGYSC